MLSFRTVEELVGYAWHNEVFTCEFNPNGEASDAEVKRELLICEIICTSSEDGTHVIIMRNITDRVRRHEVELEVVATKVAKAKDQEANRCGVCAH